MTRPDQRRRFLVSLRFVDTVVDIVNRYYEIPPGRIRSHERGVQAVSRARMIAMFTIRHAFEMSYPEIGRAFGGRDHSTVIHAVRTIELWLARDPELKMDVIRIACLVAARTQTHLPTPRQEAPDVGAVAPEVTQQLTEWTGGAGLAVEAAVDGAEPPVQVVDIRVA
ncbi:MAG: hypothetical protein A2Y38_19925 [Spirochaetes bacterium GWB1_59_5]|nr:MAG: hypothetical protein A2Y38_19925 [Spirochaetes bacterium GWB1_59_5]